jgi:hypothetical protein
MRGKNESSNFSSKKDKSLRNDLISLLGDRGLKFRNLSHLHLTSMSYDHVMTTLVGFPKKKLSSLKILTRRKTRRFKSQISISLLRSITVICILNLKVNLCRNHNKQMVYVTSTATLLHFCSKNKKQSDETPIKKMVTHVTITVTQASCCVYTFHVSDEVT